MSDRDLKTYVSLDAGINIDDMAELDDVVMD